MTMPRDSGASTYDPFESPQVPESSAAENLLPRIVSAFVAGVAVTATAWLCAWLQLRDATQFRAPLDREQHMFYQLQVAVDDYQKAAGEFPTHLADALGDDNKIRVVESNCVTDYTGTIYVYQRTNAGYELLSLGADGQFGGVGLDADLYNDGHYSASPRMTLHQFATTEATRSVFFFSAVAGVVAFIACLRFNFVDLDRGQPPSQLVLVGQVMVSAGMAGVMAFFMSVIHIPSGH
jgi:hypothetical protein